MADTRRFPSVKPLTLAQDLGSGDLTPKTTSANDWLGTALASGSFNTDYIPATLINDSRTQIEFILIDATTLSLLTTTGATIYKRGLPFHSTGNDATDETEASARKLDWTQGETKVMIGTNPPWMYGQFANRKNDELILGTWTYDADAIPRLDAQGTWGAGTEEYLITKRYGDGLAIAGAPDGNETTKGIYEKATSAESIAGTNTGSTGASLVVVPGDIAANAQSGTFVFGVDAAGSDTYAITLTPAPAAYVAGMTIALTVQTANTTACTVNVNALGAKNIKKYVNGAIADLETNDLLAGMAIILLYDGTQFILQTPRGTDMTSAIAYEVQQFFSATDITGAEAETLTNGSFADVPHTHAFFLGIGNATAAKPYHQFIYRNDFLWTNNNATVAALGGGWTHGSASSDADWRILTTNGLAYYWGDTTLSVEYLQFNDTKKLIVEFDWRVRATGAEQQGAGLMNVYAPVADFDDTTADAACFTIDSAGALYAHTSDAGVGGDETLITGVTVTNTNTYRIEFDPGVDVKFYVNGVLKATHTEGVEEIPDGATIIRFGYGGSGNTSNNDAMGVSEILVAVEK